ncbi:MAG: hypothetical protein WED04_08460 [Promethearchaeati archaeon SRVP18_Atabeyarchaeia-1]
MEQLSTALRETTLQVPNRKIENLLRVTFSPKREEICKECSLRPAYCLGSMAEFHRCRYALRIRGDRVIFPSDVGSQGKEDKAKALTSGIEDLIIKTLRRVRVLTAPYERVPS